MIHGDVNYSDVLKVLKDLGGKYKGQSSNKPNYSSNQANSGNNGRIVTDNLVIGHRPINQLCLA